MSRRNLSPTLLLLVPIAFLAAAPEGRPPDECGNPMVINQSYDAAWGKVVEVMSGDTLRVDVPKGGRWATRVTGVVAIRLVAIEAPPVEQALGAQSRDRLAKRLLGKRVQLSLSPVQTPGAPHNAMVSAMDSMRGDPIDENAGQLAAGMARFVRQGDYDVDWWVRCKYRNAEASAKASRLGIWVDPDAR